MAYCALSGFYLYDSIKQVTFSCIPEFARNLWGGKEIIELTNSQQENVEKINRLKDTLCQEAEMDPARVKIVINKGGEPIITFGGLNDIILAVNDTVITGLKEPNDRYFLIAYQKYLDKLSDDPKVMARQIKKMDSSNLQAIIGLNDRCKWVLSDEEWRFVLGHEIKGHAKNHDNSWITGLYLTASLTMLVGTTLLSPSTTLFNIVITISTGKITATLMKRYCETQADLASIKDDSAATKGALQFFKKGVVLDLVQKELQGRNKKLSGILQKTSNAVEWIMSADHPSSQERYVKISSQTDYKPNATLINQLK